MGSYKIFFAIRNRNEHQIFIALINRIEQRMTYVRRFEKNNAQVKNEEKLI